MVIVAVQFSPETYPESRIYRHLACWGDRGNTRERGREGNREGNIANKEVVAETAVTKVTQEVWDQSRTECLRTNPSEGRGSQKCTCQALSVID